MLQVTAVCEHAGRATSAAHATASASASARVRAPPPPRRSRCSAGSACASTRLRLRSSAQVRRSRKLARVYSQRAQRTPLACRGAHRRCGHAVAARSHASAPLRAAAAASKEGRRHAQRASAVNTACVVRSLRVRGAHDAQNHAGTQNATPHARAAALSASSERPRVFGFRAGTQSATHPCQTCAGGGVHADRVHRRNTPGGARARGGAWVARGPTAATSDGFGDRARRALRLSALGAARGVRRRPHACPPSACAGAGRARACDGAGCDICK